MIDTRRLQDIMIEIKKNDNSFKEKSFFGMTPTYKQSEVRDIWFTGIEHGIEQGFYIASLEGQKIELSNACKNDKHKDFYDKFLKLVGEYKIGIQYHPIEGMCFVDLSKRFY